MTLMAEIANKDLSPEEFRKMFPELAEEVSSRVNAVRNRKEWLQSRRGKFTASGIPALFTSKLKPSYSKGAETYICRVAAEQIGAWRNEAKAPSLDWGHENEPKAAKAYSKRYKKKLKNVENQKFILWEKDPLFGGTPDGNIVGENIIIQIKCPIDPAQHIKYLTFNHQKDIERLCYEYYIQMQCELLFTGAKECHFVTYHPRPTEDRFKVKRIKVYPDKEFRPILIERLEHAKEQLIEIIEMINKK